MATVRVHRQSRGTGIAREEHQSRENTYALMNGLFARSEAV